jgi:hypothetical protein
MNETEFVFVLPDIEKLSSRKKQITTVTLAEAHALHLKVMQLGSDHKERHRLFQQSLILFEKSLKTNPGRYKHDSNISIKIINKQTNKPKNK